MAVRLGVLVGTTFVPVGTSGFVEVRDAARAKRQVANLPNQPAGSGGAVPYVRQVAGTDAALVATAGFTTGPYAVRRLRAGSGISAGGRVGQTGGAIAIG